MLKVKKLFELPSTDPPFSVPDRKSPVCKAFPSASFRRHLQQFSAPPGKPPRCPYATTSPPSPSSPANTFRAFAPPTPDQSRYTRDRLRMLTEMHLDFRSANSRPRTTDRRPLSARKSGRQSRFPARRGALEETYEDRDASPRASRVDCKEHRQRPVERGSAGMLERLAA